MSSLLLNWMKHVLYIMRITQTNHMTFIVNELPLDFLSMSIG